MPSEDQKDHMSNQQPQHQQQQHQQQDTKTAVNSNTKPNSTISNEIANVTHAFKEKKKLVRRAFSMPRNLFRLSRRIKISSSASTAAKISTPIDANTTAASAAAISCNQSVQTNCDEQNNKLNMENAENNKHRTLPVSSSSSSQMSQSDAKQQQKHHLPEAKPEQDNKHRLFRRSTWKKFLFTRFILQSISLKAKQTTTTNTTTTNGRVPPLNRHAWPPHRIPGVVGLQNHGNTCFMNAVLQCLSHTDILAEYFVLDQYKADLKRRNKINSRKFGTKGELTEQLALVLKALWACKNESDYSTSFKAVVDRYGTQFRSSTQHDAQEFLFWLLDKVHEDLNTASKRKYKPIKNNYGRPDEVIAAETLANHIRCNNSFVQAVFQAQFRSSLACPRCHKQSNTFDPFHCISVQLPQLAQQFVFVTVLYAKQHPRQVKLGLSVPLGSPIVALREQLQADTGIPLDRMVLMEIQETGFVRVFCDSQPISMLSPDDSIYCIETVDDETGKVKSTTATTTTTTATTTNTTTTTTTTANDDTTTKLTLILTNVKRLSPKDNDVQRFSTPFCVQVNRDISYTELQKSLLKEMRAILKSDVFTYATPTTDMFKIRLQDPSADPDTYIEPNVEHPLFTEMIDLALSVLPVDSGPQHVKLLLEWNEPDEFFCDTSDAFVEHESVSQLQNKIKGDTTLTLEQCLEHYTKAETLSAEDAWRCPHCQKYLPVVKTLGLWSLPDILVIHFKRFRQQHTKGPQSAKLTTTVQFPLTNFDMSPHLARETTNTTNTNGFMTEDNWSPWRKLKRKDLKDDLRNNRYDLYAVCYHQGDTLETGHYTAACKNPYDHQWYKFDDQRVSVVPSDKVQDEIVNNEAYILFYQRRKVDSAECSGSNSSTSEHWLSKMTLPPEPSTLTTIISSETKKEDVDKLPETSEKHEIEVGPVAAVAATAATVTVTHSNKEIQTDESAATEKSVESVKEATTPEECSTPNGDSSPVVKSSSSIIDVPVKVESTNEDEIVDIETIESEKKIDSEPPSPSKEPKLEEEIKTDSYKIEDKKPIAIDALENDIDIEVELRNLTVKKSEGALSMSFPTQRSLWPFENHHNTIHTYTPILSRGSLNFNELLSSERNAHLRHSLSTSLGHQRSSTSSDKAKLISVAANDTLAMVRGVSSCSKDTLIYIDQQSHHRSLMDDETNFMANQPLWISPVTPHKLITVSPKN
ncbi:ubiquitin carboxyl-terminal hydrolase 31 [Sitodiplosis mosellana]|uniref:ubiquitin carboxyl-terminal hydrolase 31 n=1 Tax=Sitodiplosis mosellana TaxID=263140 RepID=UPI0024441733|nr:ubiquitin carboxyl-terminal hydrolase 31 [Sitodiplosis mosellana]